MICTIVSLLPFTSEEYKPSLVPPIYVIPGCLDISNPVFYHVKDGKVLEYIPLKGPRLNELKAQDIAKSLVNDKLNSIFGKDPEKKALPGLAWVEGEFFNLEDLSKKHAKLYQSLVDSQYRWYENLVTLADDDWVKYKQHRMINDLQRFAAKHLKMEREWLIDAAVDRSARCPFCQEIINQAAVKCKHCGEVLKPDAYGALKK